MPSSATLPRLSRAEDASAEARARLVERAPAGARGLALFDLLLAIFEERGVNVILR
ncbi:hypothetical protein [Streptomyces sp. NPDC056549]|uniref:hypothetical protein n=1 Tax=unclassified Streptomyces TaxID=2593676 RepID=UPI003687E5DC